MKKYLCLGIVLLVLSLTHVSYGFTNSVYSGTYVDATTLNTVPVNGLNPWYGTSSTVTLWRTRVFANQGTIWEANAGSPGDKPMLATTLSGLTPGVPYNLYVVQWSNASSWRIMAGTETDNLLLCLKTSGRATGGVESDRTEFEVGFGRKVADANGNLTVYIDDIPSYDRTWYDGIVYAPVRTADNPVPANGALDIAPTVTFSWTMGRNPQNPAQPNPSITKHYFYVVADEPNLAMATMTEIADLANPIESSPIPLSANKTWYWRVDESVANSGPDDPNTIIGDWWSFDTIKTKPSFDAPLGAQPQNTAAFPGDPAVLTVTAGTSDGEGGTIGFQWYRGLPGDTSSPLLDVSGMIEGAQTSRLTITTTLADEGYYYCQASNMAGSTDSIAAGLAVKRLIAHYPFDNNLNDTVGGIHGIQPSAVFIEGKAGQAVSLNGSQVIDLGLAGLPAAGLGRGLNAGTVSFWINTNLSTTTYYSGTRNTGTDYTSFRNQFSSSNSLGFVVANSTNNQIGVATAPSGNLRNGQWHLISMTWDCVTGVVSIYADGVLLRTETDTPIGGFNPWSNAMVIGAYNDQGVIGNFYSGAFDDYRVYNYALDGFEVAQLYIDMNPGTIICVQNPLYDFNHDCQINLLDLVEIVDSWLENHLVTDSGNK